MAETNWRHPATPAPETRPLRFLFSSWNLGNARPPSDLSPWIPKGGLGHDVICVALQECLYSEDDASPLPPRPDSDEVDRAGPHAGHTYEALHNHVHGGSSRPAPGATPDRAA